MSALYDRAHARLIADALDLGVEVPDAVRRIICHDFPHSTGAQLYAEAHPDGDGAAEGTLWCCEGAVYRGLAHCTCWAPVYDIEQAPPDTATTAGAMAEKCHDCAFRKGSPEREDPYVREELYDLAEAGDPFWCHQGMRRPARWRHDTLGIEIDGSPANWTPPIVDGIPYLADGTAGNLCAGWVALRLHVMQREVTP